ncbi:hypothetical protein [Butyricimonas virosa]|uniref:hypothetical protein n=1 Tax=Butyricimonas virosa TaxID=544645 RepID=UPI00266C5527|nr:hypothetical protein [Butyricimonas virosa]
MEMIEIFVAIANVLLSMVAIIIAIRSSRKTSQDATRQIESIKRLAEIQIETTLRQIEVEIQKNRLLGQQACEEWQKIRDLNNSQLGGDESYRNLRKREIMEERPQKQVEFYRACIRSLNESSGKITKLKEKLK